jgi:predicted nucleotidyltransferase
MPCKLSTGPCRFDIDAAARKLRDRRVKRRRDLLRLHGEAQQDATAIIDMIKRRFNPRRIYQWGSLLDPGTFDENSDIDIAVQGIESVQAFSDLLGAAMKMTRFPLDIVDFDTIDDLSRASILNLGMIVHERT